MDDFSFFECGVFEPMVVQLKDIIPKFVFGKFLFHFIDQGCTDDYFFGIAWVPVVEIKIPGACIVV